MANPVAGLYVDLKAEVAGFKSDLGKAVQAVGQFEQNINRRLKTVDNSFAAMGTAVKGFVGAFVATTLVQGLQQIGSASVQASQKIQIVNGTLKNLTGTSAGAKEAFDEIYAAAQRVGTDVGDFAQGFARFARAGADLGRSRGEILQFAETIQKLALVGGASTAEAASGALQLSQGLAAGVLQGDELKSILEGMPQVARAIAAEFGVSIGQLKKLGSEGAISADRVFAAIIKAAPQADKEFAALGETVDQAKAKFDNALTKFLADFDKAIGLSEALKRSLNFGAAAAEAGSRALAPRTAAELIAERDRLQRQLASDRRLNDPALAGLPENRRRAITGQVLPGLSPTDPGAVQQTKRQIAEIDEALKALFADQYAKDAADIQKSFEQWAAPVKRVLDLQKDVDKQIAGINEKSREAVKIAGIQSEVERKVAEDRRKARDDILKARGLDAPGAFEAYRTAAPELAAEIDRLIGAAQRAAESEARAVAATAAIKKASDEVQKLQMDFLKNLDDQEGKAEGATDAQYETLLKQGKARREIVEAIDLEIAQSDQLLAALQQGTEAYEIEKATIDILNQYRRAGIPITEEEIRLAREKAGIIGKQNELEQKLTEEEKTRAQVRADITKTVGTAFEDMLLRTGKVGDGFRGLLEDIQRQILRTFVTKPLQNFLDEFLKTAFQINNTQISPQFGGGSSGGGGGIFGSILGSIGSIFGGGFGGGGGGGFASVSNVGFTGAGSFAGLFADGGSFTVGGRAGVDQNLVSMGLSRGERVDITPANDRGSGGETVINIDARGATKDFVPAIMAELKQLRRDMPNIATSAVRSTAKTDRRYARDLSY